MNLFKKIFKKRQITIIALVLLVFVAGYFNLEYKDDTKGETVAVMNSGENEGQDNKKYGEATLVNTTPQEGDYFTNAKMSKEKTRSESIELIKNIISDQSASADAKSKAQEKIFEISNHLQQETTIENLISAKGIGKSIVFINDNSVNVIVDAQSLSAVDAAKVQDIVIGETNITADKIKIMEIKNKE